MARDDQMSELHEAGSITPDQPGGIPGWREGIPVLRIYTCGLFTIEILQEVQGGDPTQARYAELAPERLRGRGPGPALILLKLLVSQPGRYAPKDWLMEHLRAGEMSVTAKRLENILSFARTLLCLPSGKKLKDVLNYVRASHDSGDGYRLASFPLIWLDIDALAWYVEQACLKERFGDDPLPYWEQAYRLASRGRFLADELSSDWAKAQRKAIDDQERQCVYALARLYLARFGEAAEEEVLRMLCSYCRRHRRDEDALWPLLELLCKRGRYQEVLEWYERLEAALKTQGLTKTGERRTPHARTAEVVAFARLKLREHAASQQYHLKSTEENVLSAPSSSTAPGTRDILSEQRSFASGSRVGQERENMDEKRRKLLEQMFEITGAALVFQTWLDDEELDRLIRVLTKPSSVDSRTLRGLKNTTENYWHLRIRGSIPSPELLDAALAHLQLVKHLFRAPHTPTSHAFLCSVFSETALFLGKVLSTDMQRPDEALFYYKLSLTVAQQTNDDVLYATVLGRMGELAAALGKPNEAALFLQEAQRLVAQGQVFTLRSWLAAEEAV